MKQENKNIENLFREKLQNLEANPGANAWANVQSGIGSNAIATTAASSSWASSVIVGITITAIAVGGYFFFNKEGEKKKIKVETKISQQVTEKLSLDENEIINESIEASKSTSETTVNNVEPTETKQEKPDNNTAVTVEQPSKVTPNKVENKVTEKTTDNSVTEKTIDEIIAEHQQFVDEQDVSNSTSGEAQTNVENNTSDVTTAEKNSTKETSKNTVNQSKNIADSKLEHKKIADQVIFPNIFTPDQNGSNDVFKIILKRSIEFENSIVDILDLNGKVIASWSDKRGGWDGTYADGTFAPKGFYTFQAIIIVDGQKIPKQGSFILNR